MVSCPNFWSGLATLLSRRKTIYYNKYLISTLTSNSTTPVHVQSVTTYNSNRVREYFTRAFLFARLFPGDSDWSPWFSLPCLGGATSLPEVWPRSQEVSSASVAPSFPSCRCGSQSRSLTDRRTQPCRQRYQPVKKNEI